MAIDKATVGGKDTAGFSEEYERGYAAGRISAQPQWISVEERLPEAEGDCFTLSELQCDTPAAPKGAIAIDEDECWKDGHWEQDDEFWKVLYWAKPMRFDVPEHLAERPRLGYL